MAFTAEEQAVLSQIAYFDITVPENEPESLEEVLRSVEKQKDSAGRTLEEALGEDMYEVYQSMLKKIDGNDYKVVYSVNDDADSGFVAFAVADPNNDVTVVCRGSEDLSQVATNENSRKDLDTDLQIAYNIETDQQQEMERFVAHLEEQGYSGYYFTGHSLGGNLAIHGAVSMGDPSKVKGVTTFNSPGFNDKYWTIYRMRIGRIEGKIVNYENEYDYVSSVFTKPGKTIFLESSVAGKDFGFAHHSICNIRISNGSFAVTDKKGRRTDIVSGITNDKVDSAWGFNIIATYVYAKITGGALTGYRDFSKAALETMTAAAKETEEEAWWDITRWDCWYRMDKAFGGFVMDYQLLAGDVDTYYRKVIDMNDASVADIRAIFEKVYGLDDQYAAKIREGTGRIRNEVLSKLQEFADSITPGSSSHSHGGGGGRF